MFCEEGSYIHAYYPGALVGETVVGECDPGFVSRNRPRRTCGDQGWEGLVQDPCRPVVSECGGEAEVDGFATFEGAGSLGMVRLGKCEEGYKPDTSPPLRVCTRGGWNRVQAPCVRASDGKTPLAWWVIMLMIIGGTFLLLAIGLLMWRFVQKKNGSV